MTVLSRLLPAALTLTAALATAPAMANVVLASDNFNGYSAGSISGANGGTGWAGAWAGTASANANTLRITSNADGVASRQLDAAINSNVLISFDMQFSAGTISNNDFLGLWFGTNTGPNIGLKANCGGGSACTNDLFVRTSGTDAGGNAQNITVGTTYTLLGYLQKTGGSNVYNRFDLWVNPTAQEWSTLTGADAFDTGASSISSFSTIGFRSANLSANDTLRIDNLTISAIPEPGTLALLGLALTGLAAATRRRRG